MRHGARTLTIMLALSALSALCGCSDEPAPVAGPTRDAVVADAAAVPPAPPSAASSQTGVARSVDDDNDLYSYQYAYPAQAGAIPALRALLDADLAKGLAILKQEAREAQAMAKQDKVPYHPYQAGTEWKVVTDTPAWLSLSTLVSSYTGGAHGNFTFDTLLWDKRANRRRAPLDLFTAPGSLKAALTGPFCAELNRQRARKRGEPIDPASTDEFDECIDPLEQTVILGSTNGRVFDRIGLLIAPYNAGPYAEGDYDITLPITAQVRALVKPEFRDSFAAR